MLIKDVLTLAAEELGRPDLAEAVGTAYTAAASGAAPEGEAALLLTCYRLVENEVALDHFPLRTEETFAPADGAVLFTRFSRPPVEVLSVRTAAGQEVPFCVHASRLSLPPRTGEVAVVYTYAPEAPEIDGEVPFPERISARLLSWGVAREFLISGGRYAESETFSEKFRAALRAAGLSRRKLRVRGRRWV